MAARQWWRPNQGHTNQLGPLGPLVVVVGWFSLSSPGHCRNLTDQRRHRRSTSWLSLIITAALLLSPVDWLTYCSAGSSSGAVDLQQQHRRALAPDPSIFSALLGSYSSSSGDTNAAAHSHQAQQEGYKGAISTADKVTLPGDILLGGLFPIHMKGTKVACGEINRDRGIQRLEAMLYALDRINEDSSLLPDIKLGAILLDSCSSSTYALNQSLEFIRASINTVESSAFECKDKSTPRPKYGSKMIAGVIGGSYSEVSLQVANLLRLFRIPQVSYASTGTALSDKSLYDLFARTVPSDMFQVRAIADIVLKLGWSYVSLVSSEGLYGDSGSREFIKQATASRICIATHEKISPTMEDVAYDVIVASLVKRNATGVVLFTRAEDTRQLLLAVKRARLFTSFSWVAADGWGTHLKLVEGVEDVAWGAVTVELQAKAIPGFDQYMKALTPWSNVRNPWFSEYWQEWFECQVQPNLVQQQQVASGQFNARRRDATAALEGGAATAVPNNQPIPDDATDYVDEARRKRRRSLDSMEAPPAPCNAASASSGAADNSTQNAPSCALPPSDASQRHRSPASGLEERASPTSTVQPVARSATSALGRRRRAAPSYEPIKQFCSPNLRISETNGYRQETKVQFVVDAVYAMAHALHKAWAKLCDAQPGVVCESLKELSGGDLYAKYLLNVSFRDLAGSEVKFDERGDGLGRYIIYNFRPTKAAPETSRTLATREAAAYQSENNNTSLAALDQELELGEPRIGGAFPGTLSELREEHIYTGNNEYEYSPIGRWNEEENFLKLGEVQFFQGQHEIPESFCSRPCELGQAKIMRAGDHCCWICKTCAPWEYLPDEFTCRDCGVGKWPINNKTACRELPQKVLRWDSVFSIISITIACLGIAMAAFVTIIFIKYIDTPVVKASGRELSFILLAGIAFCHLSTFILLTKPTIFVCGSQRFLVNFGFALMYASLLVKTNRISRIFNCARKSAKRPSFISPKSQMLITGILVAIQIFLTIVWFILEPPGIRAESPEGKRDEVVLKCKARGKSFILGLVYNMILITTCTIYAVKTRKIPENFNESKFIGFTMYTTIVIWLAFVTMFFGTNNSYEIQINTMCVCISMSAYVTLFCLFSPKISIILLHPDKNVRKLTMNSATYKRPFKPVSSMASVEGRQYMTAGTANQTDGGSGGPLSTTSNVLNLAETHTGRLQESSIVSNVVNSNSVGSNCSQRTPTICTNCGAHQSMAAAGLITMNPMAGSNSQRPLSGLNLAETELRRGIGLQPGVGCAAGSSSQMTAGSVAGVVGAASTATTVARQTSGSGPALRSPIDQSQVSGVNLTGSEGAIYGMTASATALLVSSATAAATATAADVRMVSSMFASKDSNVTTRQAQVVHSKIAEPTGSDLARASQPLAGPEATSRAIHQNPQAQHQHHAHHHHHRHQHRASLTAIPGESGDRLVIASLTRLNELTQSTSASSDKNCLDGSSSSLANESLANMSQVDPATGHIRSELTSGARDYMSRKESDSALWNESVNSIDYCSDCCPSYCHCSCPACSSSNESNEAPGLIGCSAGGHGDGQQHQQDNIDNDLTIGDSMFPEECVNLVGVETCDEQLAGGLCTERKRPDHLGQTKQEIRAYYSGGRLNYIELEPSQELRRIATERKQSFDARTKIDLRVDAENMPKTALSQIAKTSLQLAGIASTEAAQSASEANQAPHSRQTSNKDKQSETLTPGLGDQQVGKSNLASQHEPTSTIQAGIAMAKSASLRRRSSEASKRRHKRESSSCFNYHDDYEYSYGLVDSNSDSECFSYDHELEVESQKRQSIDELYKQTVQGQQHLRTLQDQNRNRRQESHDKPNETEPGHGRQQVVASVTSGANLEDHDVDDEFDHSGRLTLEHQEPADRSVGGSRSTGSRRRRNRSSVRKRHPSNREEAAERYSTGKQRLEMDDHRINSVTLIEATLSTGGAIVDASPSPTVSSEQLKTRLDPNQPQPMQSQRDKTRVASQLEPARPTGGSD